MANAYIIMLILFQDVGLHLSFSNYFKLKASLKRSHKKSRQKPGSYEAKIRFLIFLTVSRKKEAQRHAQLFQQPASMSAAKQGPFQEECGRAHIAHHNRPFFLQYKEPRDKERQHNLPHKRTNPQQRIRKWQKATREMFS